MVTDSLATKSEQPTQRVAEENIVILKYDLDLLNKLNQLTEHKHLYEAVLVDATQCGFLFTAEQFMETIRLAKNLLEIQGVLVFLKSDTATAIVRDSFMGALSLHLFDNYREFFDYSPSLAKHTLAIIGKIAEGESSDLSKQVLMSTVPVLTPLGIKLKGGMDSPRKRNTLLAAIDNYTPLNTIIHKLCKPNKLTETDLMEELQALEQSRAIYPLLPKIPFLVNCFRNQTPFTLKDYLVQAKLVTQDELDEMVFELISTSTKESMTIGPLAVKKRFINSRQLEIALQDQAFYGQSDDNRQVRLVKTSGEDNQVQSLVGHLGTTDPSNLLQNFATNRETGILSVEYKDLQFRAQFEMGRVAHAKVGKVEGNNAICEFASAWHEGIFVFIQRTPPVDLAKNSCQVTKPLDKLLLDAALAKDNTKVVWKKLPKDVDSVLEKMPDHNNLLNSIDLLDPQEKTVIPEQEMAIIRRLWQALDGLTSLSVVIRQMNDLTTYDIAKAIDRLLQYKLIASPAVDLTYALDKFQQLVKNVTSETNVERNTAFLRLSLRDTIGYSDRARVFIIGTNSEVGIDIAHARSVGASLTPIIKDLDDWQVKYIEYVSQELEKDILLQIIQNVHQP